MIKRILFTAAGLVAGFATSAAVASQPPDQPDVYVLEGILHRAAPDICAEAADLAAEGLDDFQMVGAIVGDYVHLYKHLDAAGQSRSAAYLRGIIVGCVEAAQTQ